MSVSCIVWDRRVPQYISDNLESDPFDRPFASSTMAVDNDSLPPPVQQQASSIAIPTRARFTTDLVEGQRQGGGLRVHWARLKKKINTGSQDAPSESYIDDTLDGSASWRRASDYPSTSGLHNPTGSAPAWNRVGGMDAEPDEVDEIVVDNHYEGYSSGLDGAESHTGRSTSEKPFDTANSSHNPHTDKESTNTISIWDRYLVLTLLRWRLWPALQRFHSLAFSDPVAEGQYQRESWCVLSMPFLSSSLLTSAVCYTGTPRERWHSIPDYG